MEPTQKIIEKRKEVLFRVEKHIRNYECPRCSDGANHSDDVRWTIIPLYEYGDHFMPSSVVAMCPLCRYSETVAKLPVEQSMIYANSVMAEKKDREQEEMAEVIKAKKIIDKKK